MADVCVWLLRARGEYARLCQVDALHRLCVVCIRRPVRQ